MLRQFRLYFKSYIANTLKRKESQTFDFGARNKNSLMNDQSPHSVYSNRSHLSQRMENERSPPCNHYFPQGDTHIRLCICSRLEKKIEKPAKTLTFPNTSDFCCAPHPKKRFTHISFDHFFLAPTANSMHPRDAPVGKQGSCIHHLELDIQLPRFPTDASLERIRIDHSMNFECPLYGSCVLQQSA